MTSSVVTEVVVIVVYCSVTIFAVIVPPTYKLPPIPTPPATTNAPVVVDVDTVELVTLIALVTVPPINVVPPPDCPIPKIGVEITEI